MSKFNGRLATFLTTLFSVFPSLVVSAQQVNSYQDFYLFCSEPAYYYKVQSPDCERYLDSKAMELASLTEEIELDPRDPQAYDNRSSVRQELEDLWGAIKDYNQIIELSPNDANAYHKRGLAYQKLGDLNTAIADYTKAIEIEPNIASFYNNLAFARIILTDVEGGCADYLKAADLALSNNESDTYVLAFHNLRRYCQTLEEKFPQRLN